MNQNFKAFCWNVWYQPCRILLLAAVTLLLGGIFYLPLLFFAALLSIVIMVWQRTQRFALGDNFVVMRAFPIGDAAQYSIWQRRQEKVQNKSCQALTASLLRDRRALADLPPGDYLMLTHQTVRRAVDKLPGMEMIADPVPLYKQDLKKILRRQTGNRCRSCQKYCTAYLSSSRDFYLVRFRITAGAQIYNKRSDGRCP